jgi:hypothetical protein
VEIEVEYFGTRTCNAFDEPGGTGTPGHPRGRNIAGWDPPSRGREHDGGREGSPPWGGDYNRHCVPRRKRIEVSEGVTVGR